MDDKVRAHLTIEGMVQGVFFRAATVEQAHRLGVKGWVRNCTDGTVEAVAEGPKDKVEALIVWCHQGPPRAHVHRVQVYWENYRDEFKDFRIRR